MRRLKMVIMATVLAGSAVFVGAAPAQADPILRGVVFDYSECVRIGNYGIANYGWPGPLQCLSSPIGSSTPTNYWFIYA